AAPRGRVLDTATGLGYTAILASRRAEVVTTIELDPAVLEIARLNPWSQALFHSSNIEQRLGDAFDVAESLPDHSFDRIIHDPPMFKLAGHLYSTDFYRQLHRLLNSRGRLFHYIGDPDSKSGRNTTRGVIQRLQEAGFRRVQRAPQAFGVIAWP
ncbi:MAG: methyltransferase, partial [Chloroflexi bacterium]|nr:methyltransferase [Chloroflexota bacterium]